MLFAITAILKPGVEKRLEALSAELNEFLSQPFRELVLAGVLRDRDGAKRGYLALLEADSFEHAERYLHESPFYRNGLYDRTDVAEYIIEVGRLS
jgi:uncharacterized protein YciI